jgi:hypothetical protein
MRDSPPGSLGESEAKAERTLTSLTLCKLPAVLTFVTKGANPSSITWGWFKGS